MEIPTAKYGKTTKNMEKYMLECGSKYNGFRT
jgi:hypothetical protein